MQLIAQLAPLLFSSLKPSERILCVWDDDLKLCGLLLTSIELDEFGRVGGGLGGEGTLEVDVFGDCGVPKGRLGEGEDWCAQQEEQQGAHGWGR